MQVPTHAGVSVSFHKHGVHEGTASGRDASCSEWLNIQGTRPEEKLRLGDG